MKMNKDYQNVTQFTVSERDDFRMLSKAKPASEQKPHRKQTNGRSTHPLMP